MARIPDAADFARRWAAVPTGDRRRIVRAVNRGTTLENRQEAALAVVLARRQQRFWRGAWIAGPLVSVLVSWAFDLGDGWVQLGANALLGFAVLSALSVFYLRRARRAEAGNHERAVSGKRLT